MDYLRVYNKIISNAKCEKRTKNCGIIYEKHHITPKCLGGSNNDDNLVLLTPKEHFICHQLLTKIYPKNNKLKFAFFAMCNQLIGDAPRDYKVSSRTYSNAKEQFIIANSKLHSGKKLSETHINKLREIMKSNKNPMKGKKGNNNPLYGRNRPQKVKDKISKTKKDNPENNSNFKGYYVTPAGKFASSRQAKIANNCGYDRIINRCKKNSDKKITQYFVAQNSDLSNKNIGSTFRDLGWYFIPK